MISQFDISPIFLHIRRGDYVERSDYHNTLSLQYFKDASEIRLQLKDTDGGDILVEVVQEQLEAGKLQINE